MACPQCIADDKEILAIRRRHRDHAEKAGRDYHYTEEDLPSDDCDRGECQNAR